MLRDSDALIAELAGVLEPVKPLRLGEGLALSLAASALSAGVLVGLLGIRAEWLAGHLDPLQLVSTGLFLGLAVAATVTVIAMGRPQIGSYHGGWRWATAMAGLLPIAAAIVAIGRQAPSFSPELMRHGSECLAGGVAASLTVFATLVWWLRRGAPTSLERAGLVAGIAAGASGVFAVSLHCPDNDIVHIGLWHSAVLLVTAFAGRFVVPPLIRW
ncbi:MAG: DUF1109 domain-containing protein [Porphyrobacter sp.]|nr:DUF1109 domain-containing protein [Porphyrobacter sp.]